MRRISESCLLLSTEPRRELRNRVSVRRIFCNSSASTFSGDNPPASITSRYVRTFLKSRSVFRLIDSPRHPLDIMAISVPHAGKYALIVGMAPLDDPSNLNNRNEKFRIQYVVIAGDEFRATARDLLSHAQDFLAVITIGGDRIQCCDEGVVAKTGNTIVGISTIAPKGESGDGPPEIVGTYVLNSQRGEGVGKELLLRAIARCKERNLVPVHMTAVTKGGAAL